MKARDLSKESSKTGEYAAYRMERSVAGGSLSEQRHGARQEEDDSRGGLSRVPKHPEGGGGLRHPQGDIRERGGIAMRNVTTHTLLKSILAVVAAALIAAPASGRSPAPDRSAPAAAAGTGWKEMQLRHPGSDAVVLYDSLVVTLGSDNHVSKRRHRAVMLFTDNAINRYGDPRILFNAATQDLTILAARVRMRDGRIVDSPEERRQSDDAVRPRPHARLRRLAGDGRHAHGHREGLCRRAPLRDRGQESLAVPLGSGGVQRRGSDGGARARGEAAAGDDAQVRLSATARRLRPMRRRGHMGMDRSEYPWTHAVRRRRLGGGLFPGRVLQHRRGLAGPLSQLGDRLAAAIDSRPGG